MRNNESDTQRTGQLKQKTLNPNPPVLYSNIEVIASLGIKKSDFNRLLQNGIIPPPIGREGNAHRWNSKLIHAISDSMKEYGDDHTHENTIDIMLDQLVSHERRMRVR